MSQPVKQNLYRTYRPRTFAELAGQDHIVRTIQAAVTAERTSHAYLFSGPRGTGKTSAARLLGKILNCLAPVHPGRGLTDACGVCDVCRRVENQTFMDIVEIDAASNNGVEDIRQMREKVKFLPVEGKQKVYIIDEVHMLSGAAFNAFLKTLEEPPPRVTFILATTDPQKVPATIISRCQCFEFHAVSRKVLVDRLTEIVRLERQQHPEDFPEVGREPIAVIAESAQGGFRDAISLLDQVSSACAGGEVTVDDVLAVTRRLGFPTLLRLAGHLFGNQVGPLLQEINELFFRGYDVSTIGRDLLEFLRRCLLFKADPDVNTLLEMPAEQAQALTQLGAQISLERILASTHHLERALAGVRSSVEPRILLEIELVRLAMGEVSLGLEGFERRLRQIEDRPAPMIPFPMPATGAMSAREESGPGAVSPRTTPTTHNGEPPRLDSGGGRGSLLERFNRFRSGVGEATSRAMGGLFHTAALESCQNGVLTLVLENEFAVRKVRESGMLEQLQPLLDREFGPGTTLVLKIPPVPHPDGQGSPAGSTTTSVVSRSEASSSADLRSPGISRAGGEGSQAAGERVRDRPFSATNPASRGNHKERIAQIDQQARQRILAKPAFAEALKVFGGEMISIEEAVSEK
jgi:DNA polymerase III subunit gamma/tau